MNALLKFADDQVSMGGYVDVLLLFIIVFFKEIEKKELICNKI